MKKKQEMITVTLAELLWQIHIDCEVRAKKSNTATKKLPMLKVEVNPNFFNVKQFN